MRPVPLPPGVKLQPCNILDPASPYTVINNGYNDPANPYTPYYDDATFQHVVDYTDFRHWVARDVWFWDATNGYNPAHKSFPGIGVPCVYP